jgi:hypothetical protein
MYCGKKCLHCFMCCLQSNYNLSPPTKVHNILVNKLCGRLQCLKVCKRVQGVIRGLQTSQQPILPMFNVKESSMMGTLFHAHCRCIHTKLPICFSLDSWMSTETRVEGKSKILTCIVHRYLEDKAPLKLLLLKKADSKSKDK